MCVCVYVCAGVLKRSGAQLRSALVKRMQQLFGSQSPAVHVCTSAELGSAAEEARGEGQWRSQLRHVAVTCVNIHSTHTLLHVPTPEWE